MWTPSYARAKRTLDLLGGVTALAITSPLWLAIAVAIKAGDGGPVLFAQTRSGENGRPFTMYKFRSMRHGSATDVAYATPQWSDGVPGDFLFKSPDADPRVTPVGACLRRLSLDELPQLLNVVRGEMSLVGPRPELPAIASHYNDEQRLRLAVKPGLTGWAQVTGRSTHSHREKIAADLYYVDHASLAMDLQILVRTIAVTLTRQGAY